MRMRFLQQLLLKSKAIVVQDRGNLMPLQSRNVIPQLSTKA